jgi:hypothetical protein
MGDPQSIRRRIDELLSQAVASDSLHERSRLISEAVSWHAQAVANQEPAIRVPAPEPEPEPEPAALADDTLTTEASRS